MPEILHRSVAIDNVCAWPNLTQLPSGRIVATIFNQPCHGRWEGDVDCYASDDGGRSFAYLSTPAKHEPTTNRMNVAAGLAADGDLIVAASGWDKRPSDREAMEQDDRVNVGQRVLPPMISRSTDGGRSWNVLQTSFPQTEHAHIPFGDIQPGPDGTLGMSTYQLDYSEYPERIINTAMFVRSTDDGLTWEQPESIAVDHNETALLYLGGESWLVASRTAHDQHIDQLRSKDNGRSWQLEQPLTLPKQIPAHLLRLKDSRLLLTYGVRTRGFFGVHARVSEDEGKTWTPPLAIVRYGDVDGGYPSSVQNDDGSICTAYYCQRIETHNRYHMGSVVWQLD